MLVTGQRLAHYRVLEKPGAGGTGVVYRAHDEQLDRDVAIKVLPPATFADPAARARLLREAYLVRINRDPGSDWGASVPDLPGCVATGRTIESVLRRIERAIELDVRGLREDGLPVPRPRRRTVTPRRKTREVDFYATVSIAA